MTSLSGRRPNEDPATVVGFGDEWSRFDQSDWTDEDLAEHFDRYFSIFPWDLLPAGARGFDVGCGSGRWARLVAKRVGQLHCFDASADALAVAQKNVAGLSNCTCRLASVESLPIEDASMDFGYSLGVLHHVPDTQAAIRECARKLKPGAPLLLYLYYALDNRPSWYRLAWRGSELLRAAVSRLPFGLRYAASQALAGTIYFPLARAAASAERRGIDVNHWPLAYYRHAPFRAMRLDALDRFGTRLEQRFTRVEIERMMSAAGLERIRFREGMPYWCAVGFRSKQT
jgi:SAM-dependent methyltransferase